MGWTQGELLLLVLRDGTALLYDVAGTIVSTFLLLLPTASMEHIIDICIWGSGIVALTSTMALQACDDITAGAPVVYSMATGLSPTRPATAMVVLQPCFTSSGLVEVIIGTSDNTVLVVDTNGPEDQLLQARIQAPVVSMAVAPNGRFLACFTASGILTVMSTSFTTKVLDFDTSTTSKPIQMQWCGEDSLVLYWKHFLLMVGPYGHWLRFPYGQPLCLVSEADCCRIVTGDHCELLQRVPGPIEFIHHIGSTDPSALLYDAMEAFEDGDAKADENIRSMELAGQLAGAIHANISAAIAEILPSQQKLYLRAAAYGKSFCRRLKFSSDDFVAAARKLRILNQLRRHVPALCLTSAQYDRLAPPVLIERLLARNAHALAMCISKYLGIRRDRVIVHWACANLFSPGACALLDETIIDRLRAPLQLAGCVVSCTHIAATANLVGRHQLARKLLDLDFDAAEQVKLLLTMQEFQIALEKAANSMEADIIYLALLSSYRSHHLASTKNTGTEVKMLPPVPRSNFAYSDANNLLRVYYESSTSQNCRDQLQNLLVSYLAKTGFHEAGILAVGQSYQQSSTAARFAKMREAMALYVQAREQLFQCRACEEQIELLRIQSELEFKFGVTCFFDMSVSETIYNLIALGATQCAHATALLADAGKIQKRFKVPDRRFLHIKVKAFAASGQWHALQLLAEEKKPVIGYAPFVRACVKHGRPGSEIERYVGRIASADERTCLYAELNLWRQAAESAICANEKHRLLEIRRACNDAAIIARIDDFLFAGLQ